MRLSLRSKLILSYFALASFTGIVIFLLIFLTSDQRLKSLLAQEEQSEIIEEVINWYQVENSWQGFTDYYFNLHPIRSSQKSPPKPLKEDHKKRNKKENHPKPPKGDKSLRSDGLETNGRINQHGILDANKRVLIQFLTFKAGEIAPEAYLSKIIPIKIEQDIIAWLVPKDGKGISLKSEKKIFFEHTNQILLVAIFIALIVAAILGVILAKYLVQPIEALTKASQAMAEGKLEQYIVKTSHDELGDLADSFNQMSAGLIQADTQRRQMTADIAHDLGTPLQVISGYIEMAQELNMPLDQTKLGIISTEISHIKRLLSDLSILADAEGQTLSLVCREIDITRLFERIESAFQAQCHLADVNLRLSIEAELPNLKLDEERMVQVLGNLISNALRYTPKKGEIRLSAKQESGSLLIDVVDNGRGIKSAHLPHLFDRFYRVSGSRSSEDGNMGLGLSISKALIELQGGRIEVASDGEGQGCCFSIRFKINV
jgi:signal transduction histidine kinase